MLTLPSTFARPNVSKTSWQANKNLCELDCAVASMRETANAGSGDTRLCGTHGACPSPYVRARQAALTFLSSPVHLCVVSPQGESSLSRWWERASPASSKSGLGHTELLLEGVLHHRKLLEPLLELKHWRSACVSDEWYVDNPEARGHVCQRSTGWT